MGLMCGKESFDVDKNSQYTSHTKDYYRTFENVSYWDTSSNKKHRETVSNIENQSVASTVQANGHRSENSSINEVI